MYIDWEKILNILHVWFCRLWNYLTLIMRITVWYLYLEDSIFILKCPQNLLASSCEPTWNIYVHLQIFRMVLRGHMEYGNAWCCWKLQLYVLHCFSQQFSIHDAEFSSIYFSLIALNFHIPGLSISMHSDKIWYSIEYFNDLNKT